MYEKEKTIQIIKEVLKSHNIINASFFGSFARNETVVNDIDLLIENSTLTLFDVLKLEEELKAKAGYKFDIVEFSALKKSMRESVLKEAIQLI